MLTTNQCAARYGQADILAMLVENGADVNMTNARGQYVQPPEEKLHI